MRPSPVVSVKATLRPGAGMRARGAHPYRGRSVWRARVAVQASLARRVVAPYEVAAVNGTRASGVASIPLTLTRQMGGSRKASLTLARAARPEGRGGDSQEAGGTLVPPPLVCLRRIAALQPVKNWYMRLPYTAAPFPGALRRKPDSYAHRPVSISPKIEQYSRHRTATHCPG